MHIGFQGFRQRVTTFYSGNNGLAGIVYLQRQYSGRAESDFMLAFHRSSERERMVVSWGQRANIFSAFFQTTGE